MLVHPLALLLLDEKGNLQKGALREHLVDLEANLYAINKDNYHQQLRLIKLLHAFENEPSYAYLLKRIHKPTHPLALKILQKTLGLPPSTPITDLHAKLGALAALFSNLRDAAESCFVTAFAVHIHEENPLQFLSDIAELFGTGVLRKVISGVEYAVAFNLNFEKSSCPLLQAWEYTIASFAAAKTFSPQANLLISLGLDSHHPLGLTAFMASFLQRKAEELLATNEGKNKELEAIYNEMKYYENRAQGVSSEREFSLVQATYQMKRMEWNRVLSERDLIEENSRKIAALFPFLLQHFKEQLGVYFREEYDPYLGKKFKNNAFVSDPWKDTGAAFRLLYTHGRANPAVWSRIANAEDFIQAIAAFLIATEVNLSRTSTTEGIEAIFSELFTALVLLVRKEEFLEGAFIRLREVYGAEIPPNPLEHLDFLSRTPWSQVSQLSLESSLEEVIKIYCAKDVPLKVKRSRVESPLELLVFYLDTLKELPLSIQKIFIANPEKSLLTYSPSHIFLFRPGEEHFVKGWWENNFYSYTWARDQWILPALHFCQDILLDRERMSYLIESCEKLVPEQERFFFKHALPIPPLPLTPKELKEYVMSSLSYERWFYESGKASQWAAKVDALLYELLPLFPSTQLQEKLKLLFYDMEEVKWSTIAPFIEKIDLSTLPKFLSAQDLKNWGLRLLQQVLNKDKSPFPFRKILVKHLQKKGLAMPSPLLFADSTYPDAYFGFVVNPGNEKFELWVFDSTGSRGEPMVEWEVYMRPPEKEAETELEWGIFTSELL